MLKPVAFANAITTIGVTGYMFCMLLSAVAPDLLFSIGQSWFHTFNLNAIKVTASMDLGTFLLGGVSVGALVWIASYAGAILYNRFAKNG